MIYYLSCICLLIIFDLIFRKVKIVGQENVPQNGGYIIAANHVSYFDPVAIGYAVWRYSGRVVYYMAKLELASKLYLKLFFRHCRVIFIERGQGDRSILKQVIDLLKQSQIVLIFPQESSIPEKQKLKSGVGLLACHSQKPILPVKVEITGYRREKGFWPLSKMILKWFFGPGKIKVKFGQVIKCDETIKDRWEITNLVMEKIYSL